MDTGSEISFISKTFLERLEKHLHKKLKMKKSRFDNIGVMTGNTIPVIGTVGLHLTMGSLQINHDFEVIEQCTDDHPLLIGTDLLNKLSSYTFDNAMRQFIIGKIHKVPCQYLSLEETQSIKTDITLTPWKMLTCQLPLPFGFNYFKSERVISGPANLSGIIAIPAISCVKNGHITVGLVNTTERHKKLPCKVTIEDDSLYNLHNFAHKNTAVMREVILKYPLIRPVLESEDLNDRIQLPTISLLNTIRTNEPKENVSVDENGIQMDLNLDPNEYAGEGIDFSSGELTQCEVEDLLYPKSAYTVSSAEDVPIESIVDLEKYPKDIQPYIKDIFIDSYPDVVAKHNWDAGELSFFLGKCALKLKENEKLPKNRKIYALTGPEQEQMDEIIAFMLKLNLIRESPEFDKNPGYGCACYLIARKNNSARLIVDFSTVNPFLECPAPVVPDTARTIEKIRGFALATIMDLKQGFWSVKLQEKSKKLTVFLLKDKAYEFQSLPTGCAASPVIYNNRLYKALNYIPATDEHGNTIWDDEENSKAVLIKKPLYHQSKKLLLLVS